MRKARVAVGIPTHQEADSIENVVRQVDDGLARLFDPAECVIVNVDSDSPDGTSEIFLSASTACRKEAFVIECPPRPVVGRTPALPAIVFSCDRNDDFTHC